MRISDWSSDVCSSDLLARPLGRFTGTFSVDVSRRSARQLLGQVPAIVPDNDRADRALRGDQDSPSLGLSAMLAGPLAGWHTNFVGRYTRGWSASALARVAAGSERTDRTRSRSEGLDRKSTRLNSSHSCAP